ncbi:TPA: hypothetical protein ACJMGS_001799, partial [Neisseria meningitidis]
MPSEIVALRNENGSYNRPRFSPLETFAKFLSLPTAETQTQVFSCFRPKYRLILPKYPLNPPRIPDNQAS